MATTLTAPVFHFPRFVATYDARRRERGLGWYEFADELWEQSSALNEIVHDHPLCGGALSRQEARGEMSCQYSLFMLRWLGKPPEAFLTMPGRHRRSTKLPSVGPDQRLRWNLPELHAALNDDRRAQGLTWASLAGELGCTPARLTNLKGAKQADLELVMRVTQWLRRPAADFIHPANW